MKGYIVKDGHEIPIGDEIDHLSSEACECNPIPVIFPTGEILYQHFALDHRELIDAAEQIRIYESVLLCNKATHTDAHFYPFQQKTVKWPNAFYRK